MIQTMLSTATSCCRTGQYFQVSRAVSTNPYLKEKKSSYLLLACTHSQSITKSFIHFTLSILKDTSSSLILYKWGAIDWKVSLSTAALTASKLTASKLLLHSIFRLINWTVVLGKDRSKSNADTDLASARAHRLRMTMDTRVQLNGFARKELPQLP